MRIDSRGQTLVIAIMVMFILAAIGAVFIAMVARNLLRSQRFSDVDVVAQIAEAGIRYADEMLTSSEDGADWRPVPDNDGVSNVPVYPNEPPVAASDWEYQRDKYPDFKWTRAWWPTERPAGSPEGMGCAGPTGGYTAFNTGQGRFLLRVSYNPNPEDPFSKYIKIESIGRLGTVDNDDPTTLKPHGNTQLRREITAYKPIGITDYLRFVTNKDNRPMEFALGCPGFKLSLGRPDPDSTTHKNWYRGGPVRVNGDLVWYCDPSIDLFLRGVHPADPGGSPTTDLVPLDGVEVAGEIRFADPNSIVQLTRMEPDGSLVDTDPISLKPSDDPDFTTAGGFYRDGSDFPDVAKAPRGVKRIDPPVIDHLDPTRTIARYLSLTLYSGERVRVEDSQGRWRWNNIGQYGWGRGVYIGNTRDRQDESETLIGGFTLRADWLKPGLFMGTKSSGWHGPYYIPPGALITLHPNDTDGDGQPDFSITRTDLVSGDRRYVWHDAWGEMRPEWGATVTMPYGDSATGKRTVYKQDPFGDFGNKTTFKTFDWNGVIHAEGNIRIRGMLPPNTQLTVVSNRTIYIEGNLLKFRDPTKPIDPTSGALDPWRGADNTCGLALLARDNICVNTTQFFSPLNSITPENVGSDAQNNLPPFHVIVNASPENRFRCAFDFGPWESERSSTAPSGWMMYVRHAGQYGPSYINAWLNPVTGVRDFGLLWLNWQPISPTLPKHVWGIGDPRFNAPGWGIGNLFVVDVFNLAPVLNVRSAPAANRNFFTYPGAINLLTLGLDETTYTRNNYLIGGLAIQPMDIRIEAVLYAQEGSFFVIPGPWFNSNPADVPGGPRPEGVRDQRYPYFGQALDIRVIVDGAVSENIPAAVSDVEEWMSKWGKIPEYHGSTTVPTAHPNEGFTILYDDHVGWPLSDLGASSDPDMPIRRDRFGRALPIAPRLPVSGSLLYFGDVM